nr:DUF397 domain-containing protein [Actinoplanes polyasparticus]
MTRGHHRKSARAVCFTVPKNPNGACLMFTIAEWAAFVGGAKDGEFDASH